MLPQLQLHSVFEHAAKTFMAWYKIVVPYKSISFFYLITFCEMCRSLLCTNIRHQIVLVAILKRVCFTANTVDCWLILDFLWKLLAVYIRVCFSIIVPHFHISYTCFIYNLTWGLYSHILKIDILAVRAIFCKNHFLFRCFKGSVNIWSILLFLEIRTSSLHSLC